MWLGYVVFPFAIWKIIFPKDALLDFGLRTRNFFKHAKVYSWFLLIIVFSVWFASQRSDFVNYYPYYSLVSRIWYDFCFGKPCI